MFWMESVRLSMSAIPGGETEIFWRSVNAGLLASVAKYIGENQLPVNYASTAHTSARELSENIGQLRGQLSGITG